MKITIAEPVLINPLEQFKPTVATNTRKLLAEIFLARDTTTVEAQPLDKEVLKEMKQLVYTGCDNKMVSQYSEHPSPEAHMLRAVGVAASVADFEENREGSYRVEFAFQWLRGYLFKNNLPMPTEFPANTLGALSYPARTCCCMDDYLSSMRVIPSKLLYHLKEAVPPVLLAMYEPRTQSYYGKDLVERQTEVNNIGGYCGVVYTEDGTAWFAGFLNADDVLKLRFRRMRLGAAIKELTGDDNLARKAADIRDLSSYDLVLHPNDRPFGDEYVRMREEGNSLESCMAHSAGNYDAPFNVHPCDVYSCAYYGQGDNGLVLVEAQQGGIPVGRGILNVHTKQIVRWYGEYKASVMLKNTFGIKVDGDALDDVQLALIQDGAKIAAPYLDGCQACDIEDGELYVRHRGDIVMDDTSGYQDCKARELDTLSGDYYPESDLEYQPIHDTYYNPDNTHMGYFCPITEEYCNPYATSAAYVDGEVTRISDVVYFGYINPPGSWENLGGSIGWTENSEGYSYDDETEEWYTNEQYDQLIAEREEQEEDKDEAA
ncbi:hypothetical protein BF2512_16 [Dickeya phage BF25/12]|uniref:Uncharacterized protein n=1 Tax=Dickeya phage BF25/12 TaxID=1698708 RepID=A0A219MH12_9CAUD|nr:hypothetical protein HOR10_gp16 [Dickeya phage BF25/12]ALA46473.1 hypothetical protein BF2512_16 [Dickeya phage BF25/12]